MTKRPNILVCFAVILIGGGAIFLARSNFQLATVSGVMAYSLWRVRPWGYWVSWIGFGISTASLFYGLLVRGRVFLPTLFFEFIAVVVVIVISAPEVRRLFFYSSLRWWERPKRHQVSTRAELVLGGVTFGAEIIDVSTSGCFARSELELSHDEVFAINFGNDIDSKARIARVSHDPKGFGLEFVGADKSQTEKIRRFIERN